MSEKHVAKHRRAPEASLRRRLARSLRRPALFSGVALAATGLTVSTGVLATPSPIDGAAATLSSGTPAAKMTQSELAEREDRATRSIEDRRPVIDVAKARTLSAASGVAKTGTVDLSKADPKSLARALMPQFGLSSSQFSCLDNIWSQESGWNVHADNPTSSAYGIPQALPGSKMSSAGPDWENNAVTQIKWGLGYIKSRYGSACSAWSFKQGAGWY